jgi:hypothetical protein
MMTTPKATFISAVLSCTRRPRDMFDAKPCPVPESVPETRAATYLNAARRGSRAHPLRPPGVRNVATAVNGSPSRDDPDTDTTAPGSVLRPTNRRGRYSDLEPPANEASQRTHRRERQSRNHARDRCSLARNAQRTRAAVRPGAMRDESFRIRTTGSRALTGRLTRPVFAAGRIARGCCCRSG